MGYISIKKSRSCRKLTCKENCPIPPAGPQEQSPPPATPAPTAGWRRPTPPPRRVCSSLRGLVQWRSCLPTPGSPSGPGTTAGTGLSPDTLLFGNTRTQAQRAGTVPQSPCAFSLFPQMLRSWKLQAGQSRRPSAIPMGSRRRRAWCCSRRRAVTGALQPGP